MEKEKVFKTLTLSERNAVEEFRRRMENELDPQMKNDYAMLRRFMKARDFNLDKAEDMLRKHLAWSKLMKLDTIKQYNTPEVLTKYFPYARLGWDKEGVPLMYFSAGKLDGKGIFKSTRKCDISRNILKILDADVDFSVEQSKKHNKVIDQWVYIFDFDGFTLSKATHRPSLEVAFSTFMMYEAHYPERLKAAYAINTSVYFAFIFQLIKPLLSGNTLQKINIFGPDGWQEELLKVVDADILPAFLGGKRTDPDGNPLCKTVITSGGDVDEKYFIKTKDGCALAKDPDAKKLTVSRRSKYNVVIKVAEASSFIEWEFQTESKDIEFGVYYKETADQSKLKELVQKQRVEANLGSEAGLQTCEKPGIYILIFDNTYSWLQQKEIYCRAYVVTPMGKRIPAIN